VVSRPKPPALTRIWPAQPPGTAHAAPTASRQALSGNLRRTRTHTSLTRLGDSFVTVMHRNEFGDYQSRSRVIAYQRDQEIGWAPGPVGREPFGHTYTYRLEPDGACAVWSTSGYMMARALRGYSSGWLRRRGEHRHL
jgi:hypothetical protein